jgi:hypothetical protein
MSFGLPDNSPIADPSGKVDISWLQWFSRVSAIVNANQQAGTTANRPVRGNWIGRRYFDTTLGKPVFVRSVDTTVSPPVTTWVDGAGGIDATVTYNPGSLADGAGETSSGFTVTGAAFGDFVLVAAPYDLAGVTVTGYVSAANTVRIRVQNESGGVVDLASGSWNLRVLKLS